jgi:hypothetical protein
MGETVTTKCGSCGRAVSEKMRFCNFCGWDNARSMRMCLKCEGPVILHNGAGASGAAGGGMGIGGFLLYWLLGIALSLTILFAIGSGLAVMSVFTMGFKCTMCDKPAPDNILGRDEKEEKRKRRFGLTLGAIGMGVGCVLCFSLWVWAVRSRLRGD